jgi:hypothetical protein
MIPPVKYLSTPVLKSCGDRFKMDFQIVGQAQFPNIVHPLCILSTGSVPDVQEPLFVLVDISKQRTDLAPSQKHILLVIGQVEVSGQQNEFTVLDVLSLGLGHISDGVDSHPGHDFISHLLNMEAVNNHMGLRESNCTSITVRQPHINADQLDRFAIHAQEKADDIIFSSGWEHVNDAFLAEVGNNTPHLPDVDFVNAKYFRSFKAVLSPQRINVLSKHVSDGLFCDPGTSGNIGKLVSVAFLCDEIGKPLRHVMVGMHDRQWFLKGAVTFSAFEALSVDLQCDSLAVDRGVMEKLWPGAVGVKFGKETSALWT